MMSGYVQTSPVLLSTVVIFKVHWWGPSHTPHVMDDCTERTDRCPEADGGRVRTLQTGRKLVCNKPVVTGAQISTVYTLPMSTYRIPKLWKLYFHRFHLYHSSKYSHLQRVVKYYLMIMDIHKNEIKF